MESIDIETITVVDIVGYLQVLRNNERGVQHVWQLHDFENLYCTITHTGDIYSAMLNFNNRNKNILETELEYFKASISEHREDMQYYKEEMIKGVIPRSEGIHVLFDLDTLAGICKFIIRNMLNTDSETYILVREDRKEECDNDCPALCEIYTRYKKDYKFSKYLSPNMVVDHTDSGDEEDQIYSSDEDSDEDSEDDSYG